MPRVSSSTGLVAARIRPVSRPRKKQIDLSGCTKPAPFVLRPFSGLFNPYPYGCSVLCNHPADGEAKDVVRRAKDCWATEGKALLLPAEMELIRATLLAGGRSQSGNRRISRGIADHAAPDATAVPEELFRHYAETDSRPLTPTPTLASGPALCVTSPDPPAVHPRERTTLVLDLRANSQEQDIETLSWHALSLEPLPSPRRTEVFVPRPTLLLPLNPSTSVPAAPPPTVNVSNASTPKNTAGEGSDSESDEPSMRRRGKRLRKRKCRRGSTYGQQNEVRDPPEPLETQVSQVEIGLGDNSARPPVADGTILSHSSKEPIASPPYHIFPESFIDADILKHLGRQLDRDTVEGEFSAKRKIALEEALRVKSSESRSGKEVKQETGPSASSLNVPRVFSRQSSRFELPLDSRALAEMSPLDYLGRHVFVTPGRKLIFRRAFNRYFEEDSTGTRRMLPDKIQVGLEEVMGRSFTEDQSFKFASTVGPVQIPVDFRTWCGICAAAERLLVPLPPRDADPPTWIERVDLEGLERRLRSVKADSKLALLLTEIRDR
ncbi:uncharacterized protein LOC107221273 [Neodiprion lecontei]|uniref:Uncharacterized protein LOC107221273 n=1 Tax=Neodiprion lecontei TaxID=441921 RepID=A0ABM3G8J9_NEOLC|nr:uncharacterized protein LOC107221273 [Neodiprion lecontei]